MEETAIEIKQVTYRKFISNLRIRYNDYRNVTGKDEHDIGKSIKKTGTSIRNCFNDKQQTVSDKVLTLLMKAIGVNGKIEWTEGVKFYFIED